MLPIQFIFLTVKPVIDMRLRCKTGGKDYPPEVPQDITKVLELDIVSCRCTGTYLIFSPFLYDTHQIHSFFRQDGSSETLKMLLNHLSFLLV